MVYRCEVSNTIQWADRSFPSKSSASQRLRQGVSSWCGRSGCARPLLYRSGHLSRPGCAGKSYDNHVNDDPHITSAEGLGACLPVIGGRQGDCAMAYDAEAIGGAVWACLDRMGVVAALCLSRPLPPVWQCAAVSVAAGLDRGEHSMLCFGWRGLRSGQGNGNWGGRCGGRRSGGCHL
jgi:hypothetical protein